LFDELEPTHSVRIARPRRAAPADAVRPTRAEVNLEALRHNLRVVTKCAAAKRDVRVWPVLKADGYGHGAPAVARTLERAGAQGFCVALLEEAMELRDAGIVAPIVVMGGSCAGAYEEIAANHLVAVVYDVAQVEGLARAARALGRRVVAHLKVDTGMARLGVRMSDLEAFAERVRHIPEVAFEGLMTHLACADESTQSKDNSESSVGEFTAHQLGLFDEATVRLQRAGIVSSNVLRHVANSAALLQGHALFDAVRPGIALFGISPLRVSARGDGAVADASPAHELRPAMRVRSEVVDVRSIATGESVGYSAMFRVSRPSRIATIPMGYADGLSRHLTNRGQVLVRGKRAPLVGAVSMDMAMIDVTDVPGVALRDEVVVLGSQEGVHGKDVISADEVARAAGTIAWEVVTSISRRVPRFYREP